MITREITISNVKVTVPVSFRYIDEFLRLKCARDIMGLYPNGKEITESLSVFNAMRSKINLVREFGNKDVICLVPGDGKHPRTGALVSCRTRWQVFSIDPQADLSHNGQFQRLTVIKDKAENHSFEADLIVVLGVHSHAPIGEMIEKCKAKRIVVVDLPCCREHKIYYKGNLLGPIRSYQDHAVFSPKNTVNVYDIETRKE